MLGETRYLKRPHPPGQDGIRTSLREVALRIGEGRNHEDVLRWTRNVIERERLQRAFRADTPRKRAELLLGEVQEKVWTPDPVGTEFMAASRLLACDLATRDKDCFATGDCDDKVSLMGAALLSVGIDAVAVGHSYTADKVVSHVLTAGWIDGAWHYADPTLHREPLGTVVDFTHEVVLEPFTGKVLCEGRRCLNALENRIRSYIQEGTFVGVSGGFVRRRAPLVLELGAPVAEDSAKAGTDAARKELGKSGGDGISRDDARAVGQAAGTAAATAACVELGPGAVACGAIGGVVGDAIGAIVYDVLNPKAGPGMMERVSLTMLLHNRLFPNEAPWKWIAGKTGYGFANVHGFVTAVPPRDAQVLYTKYGFPLSSAGVYVDTAPTRFGPPDPMLLIRFVGADAFVRSDLIGRSAAERVRSNSTTAPASSSSSAAPIALAVGAGILAWALL